MPLSGKFVLRLAALALGVGASIWAADRAAEMVEARSLAGLRAALDDAGFGWARVEVDGLEARLSGEAPDEATRFRALRAAGTATNPANLRDAMTVRPPAALPRPEFRLEILRSGSDITVLGLLPGGVLPEADLLESLSTIEGIDRVTDLVANSPDPAPAHWRAAQDAAVGALAALLEGRLEMTPDSLSVAGLAPDHEEAGTVATTLTEALPSGIVLTTRISAPTPVVSPFVARFHIDASGARFDACASGSAEGRLKIEAAARQAGAEAAARCLRALGAPDPQWDDAVAAGIGALAATGGGTLTVTDLTVTLTPGAEADAEDFRQAMLQLETELPAAFTLGAAALPQGAQSGDARPAEFSATLSPEGTAIIRGATSSRNGRSIVESVARAHFPDDRLHLSLHRRSGLPESWSVRVLAGLDAFAALDSGRLSVTPDMLTLTGRSGDPALSTALASNLTELLGPSTPFLLDIDYEERLDPVTVLPWPEACLDRVNAIQTDTKITFGPGSTELDIDALRIVRRIAAVLRDCVDADMEIGGHTDSQGGADMNKSLSQARADAVFNALIAEKVPSATLSAVGYGETQPIASNDDEDGRKANRRIEFSLRRPLLGPDLPPQDGDAEMETEETNGQN